MVAVNRFPTDTDAEIDRIIARCRELGVNTVLSTVWADGGRGGEALAQEVVRLCEEETGDFTFAYTAEQSLREKIEAVVRKIYGGDGVTLLPAAEKQLRRLEELGFGGCPVCIAKTQYSFSDDPTRLGAPTGLHRDGEAGEDCRGRRLCGGADGGYSDDARPAAGAGSRKN